MEEHDKRWEWVRRRVVRLLGRHVDAETWQLREDLAQEACMLVWRWAEQLQDPKGIAAAIRTITRRHRSRALATVRRHAWLRYVEFGVDGVAEPAQPEPVDDGLDIAGRHVPLAWARRSLGDALERLNGLDRKLLLAFHEGFCCAELAHRFGRSEDSVKARIHRARRRVRTHFEGLVRAADDLDGFETKE